MSDIEFTSKQKQAMSEDLQHYLENEFDVEIGQFDAEFLFEHICKNFGPAFYNKGLQDAQAIVEKKVMDITDEIYQIEKISDF
ncbi:DUF2164 domain-containing protein [Vibrio sp. ZSDE26]|uniref:DUF2164 domain-containing protein n=1 Tax=Vibrio amylolyticus TaxID=2847292 RepID=A0A9X1XJH5_9VIBR|nr:DUF2164 domain-containing protein [Vibrio amylolyticus]MCK6263911.1 DUF2164 domain-containing protein [Vibrio amylolyticus]